MKYTAAQIAFFLNGEVDGDGKVEVKSLSKIEEGTSGTLSFLANPKYTRFIYQTKASIVLVSRDFKPEAPIQSTLIRVDNPYEAIAKLLRMVEKQDTGKVGIDPKSNVDPSAKIGENVYIGSFSYIGKNAIIGDRVKIFPQVYIDDNAEVKSDTILYAGVKVFKDCVIGANCIIHGNTVIGSDGFGFVQPNGSNYDKIPQVGNVIIEDDVEIGSNCSIDRATMGSTILRKGVKMDNLIQIAHNVEIGENSIIVAQVGISGSTKVGSNCIVGGQVGIAGHLQIADGVKIGAQAGVNRSFTEKGEAIQGTPATKIRDFQKSAVIYKKLPQLQQDILKIQRELEALKSQTLTQE